MIIKANNNKIEFNPDYLGLISVFSNREVVLTECPTHHSGEYAYSHQLLMSV